MIKKILIDNPHLIHIKDNDPESVICPVNYYRGAMVVDEHDTYHFYRQDNNGTWSHKQGTLPIERYDSSKKIIWDLLGADKDYKTIVYEKKPCAYFFIPKNAYLDTRVCS